MTQPTTPTGQRLASGGIIEAEPWLLDDVLDIEAEAREQGAAQERARLLRIGHAAGPHESAATVWSDLLQDLGR